MGKSESKHVMCQSMFYACPSERSKFVSYAQVREESYQVESCNMHFHIEVKDGPSWYEGHDKLF